MIVIYIIVCLIVSFIFVTKNKYFFVAFFFVLLVQPIFQKLADPTIYGETLRNVTIGRIQTNLMLFVCCLIVFPFLKLRKNRTLVHYSIYFFLFILFHVLSIAFSQDVYQSFNLFIIAIIQPILFFYILMSIRDVNYKDIRFLNRSIAYIVLFCFVLGILFMFYEKGISAYAILENRGSNGVWINNYSLQILSLVFPIIILGDYGNRKFLKYVLFAVVILMEILTMSRTLIAVLILQFFLMIYWKLIKPGKIFVGFGGGIAVVIYLLTYMNFDIKDFLLSRFTVNGGNIIETALADARFVIYETSFRLLKEHLWTGVGLGNFYKYTYQGFSDSHNLYLSVMVSRGFFVFVMVLYAIGYFFWQNVKLVRNSFGSNRRMLLCLRVGMIGYLVASMTGSDLFTYAGLCNARPMYFLIFVFVIQEKIRDILIIQFSRNEFYFESIKKDSKISS